MTTTCLYRKWRSQTFKDLIGQDHVTKTLQNAVVEGRISHAYLFAGPRGTGKTSTAKLLAKVLNCKTRPPEKAEPCNECSLCRQISSGYSIDIIEIDAASNRGIDEIRDLREKIKFAPTQAVYKVYIIDEVHMLTTEASNALLKTLEEPPPKTVFVLATTEPHKLLPTVVSRCQRFDFKRIEKDIIETHLDTICMEEDFTLEPKAREFIASAASGSLRDALSLLDQVSVFSGNHITEEAVSKLLGTTSGELIFKLSKAIENKDSGELLSIIDYAITEGVNISKLIEDLIIHYRNLLILSVAGEETSLVFAPKTELSRLVLQAKSGTCEAFLRAIKILGEIRNDLRWNDQPRIAVEMGLLRLALWSSDLSMEALRQRIISLENRFNKIEQLNKIEPFSKMKQQNYHKEVLLKKGSDDIFLKNDDSSINNKDAGSKDTCNKDIGSKDAYLLKDDTSPGRLTYSEILERWPLFLERLKNEKRTLHAIVVDGKPTSWDNGTLIITFPFNRAFHKETVEAQAHLLRKVFNECFGVSGRIIAVLGGNAKEELMAQLNTEPPEQLHEDLVKDVLEMFDGTVIEG